MTHIAPLVAVVLASLLGGTAARASILCTWTKVLPNADVHCTFLRRDSSSVRLYHSAWSGERALLSCSWSDDAAVIQNYFSLCRERTQEFSDHADGNLNVNVTLEAEHRCVSLPSPGLLGHGARTGRRSERSADAVPAASNSQSQDERSEVRVHQRVKRGFIVPGTLWCGSGNKAPSYEDLGVFANTDSCCREHDQCKHTILSFHSEFGVFNSNIFTMSHCECDNRFRHCLMEANDSISHAVGYTFFNLLKMHCFEFSHRLQCTQRNWFGMCKESKMSLYAEVYAPTLFESVGPTEDGMNSTSTSSSINTTTPAELQASSMAGPSFYFITVPTPSANSTVTKQHAPTIATPPSSVPTPSTSLSSTSITVDSPIVSTLFTSTPSTSITLHTSRVPTSSTSLTATSIPPVTNGTTSIHVSTSWRPTASAPVTTHDQKNSLPTKVQTPTEQDMDFRVKLLACSIFKDLDKCINQIPPNENRYGLQNPEPRTLYHCNCTSRLFQTLAEQPRLTDTQESLLEHVSPSCFLPQACTAGKTCTAVLVKAEFPSFKHSNGEEVEEQRHLHAVKLNVRKPKTNRAKRKDRTVTLHKLCLRITRRKMKRSRKQRQNAQRQEVRGGEEV